MSEFLRGLARQAARRTFIAVFGLLAAASAFATPSAVSITAPTASQKFGTPAQITIAASVTPASGLAITKVEFYRGSTTLIATATTSPYSIVWSNPATGTYSLTAKAYDSSGNKTSSSVSITVQTNVVPTVSLTAPTASQKFGVPTNITLTATASDSDGTISKVDFLQGSTLIGTATTSPYSIVWNNPATGTYSLTAKATDNSGGTKTSTAVSITVETNVVPTVSISSPATGTSFGSGATVSITASASDTDGTISQVEFFQGTTSLGVKTASPFTISWVPSAPGSYSLTAKATDSSGGTKTSSAVSITVLAPPTVSITAPANNASFSAPATIPISATATAPSGATISKVDFFNGSTLLGTDTTSPYSFSWTSVAAGTYTLTAKATDSKGGVNTSAPINVTVQHAPPTVSISSPTAGTSFGSGATVTVTASASETGGTISQVEFFAGTTSLGVKTASPYTVTWIPPASGSYSLTAKATDTTSGTTTSSAVAITVLAAPTVSLTSPANNATFTPPATISLAATASAASGATISKVDFFDGSTLLGTDTSSPYSFSWTSVPAGNYTLTARATDSKTGVNTSAPINVTVHPPAPTVSITSPSNNASFGSGVAVTLTATATETGGTISKVEFFSGGISLGSKTSSPFTVSWVPPASGGYSITAIATDSTNVSTTSNALAISVFAAPTVSITAPANNAAFTSPATIPITATASAAATLTISKVDFFNGATLLGTKTATPYTFSWTGVAAGNYTLTAKATDSKTGATTSAPVNVVVNVPHQNPTVSITSPASGVVSQAPTTINIAASATPGSGLTIDHVEFYNDSTKIASVASAPYTATMTNVASGEYLLTAKAFDNTGASTTSAGVIAIVDGADSCTNTPPLTAAESKTMLASYGKLPLGFEENAGQSDARVKFLSRGTGYQLFLTQDSSMLALRSEDGRKAALRMSFVDGNAQATMSGLDRSVSNTNYLIGSDPSRWHANVANYGRVRYASIYPGIDAVYHAAQGKLEYDLEVAPNADPDRIRFAFEGMENLSIDDKGALVLRTAAGNVEQFKPVAYQSIGGVRKEVEASYRVLEGNRVAFALGAYDRNETLVVDPVLVYSTYLSGSDGPSGAYAIAISRCGEAYVAGSTLATAFPTTPGAFDTAGETPSQMGFVSKLNQSGTALLYSTFVTGTQHPASDGYTRQFTDLFAIALDSTGHAYVAGDSNATDFPVTSGALFTAPPSDPTAVLAKLNTDGNALIYGTYMDLPSISSIAVDSNNNAYVTGVNVLRKVAVDGKSLVYSFSLGSGGTKGAAVAVDASGNAYVAGEVPTGSSFTPTTGAFETTIPSIGSGGTGFVSKVNPAGNAVVWATYFGNTGTTVPTAIALDSTGRVYVAGYGDSKGFPVTGGALHMFNLDSDQLVNTYAFAGRLAADGTHLDYYAWIGGMHCFTSTCSSAGTQGQAIAVDSSSNAWIVGFTNSNRIPLTKALNSNFSGVGAGTLNGDSFAVKLSPTGTSMIFGTILNGTLVGTGSPLGGTSDMSATGVQVDSIGSAYVVGRTNALDFPTTPGAIQTVPGSNIISNAYVTKINETKDTTTALGVTPNPTTVGTSVLLTATVTGNNPSNPPTGSVNFLDGTTSIGTVNLTGNSAQLVTTSLTGGSHALTASYSGDAHNNPSFSTAVTEAVTDPNTGPTITLTGIADGAAYVVNSGSVYHGLTVIATANAAAGNLLTRLTITLGTSSVQWGEGTPSVTQQWVLPDLSPGIYTIYASVMDNVSHTTTSSPVRFAVVTSTAGSAPSVAISSPTNGSTLTGTGPFPLTATATPIGSATITSVKYYAGPANVGTGFTAPTFSASWIASAGTYSLIAVATDSTGAIGFSAPITVTVFIPPPPTVTLTSPLDGSSYYTTDVIPLAATASGNAGATIAKVDFYSDNSVVGTATTSPYTYPWTTATAGSHYIQAVATDSRGITTPTPGNTITVSVPTTPAVAITSPANGASFVSPASIPITVNTAGGGGATVARVDFYSGTDLIASSSSAPWGVTWSNVGPGSYQLTAVVTNNNGVTGTSAAVSVTVTSGQPQIVLDAGIDGSTVNDSVVLISGTVQAPPNSGISVNGFVGHITGDGHFFINDVPLQPGVNSLPVTLATQDGATATRTVAITFANPAAFSVDVDHDSGIAPLAVTFTVESLGSAPVATIEFDFDGDGVVDYTANGLAAANPTVTFGSPGYNRATVRFKDSGGNVLYTTTKAIHVYSATDHFNMLRGIYQQMLDRLRVTNIDGALTALTNDAGGKFQPIFTSLGANLANIVDQLGTIDHATVTSNFAEIVLTRNEGGQTYAYSIHLVRAPDGIWRIDGM